MSNEKELEEVKARNKELEDRLARLQAKVDPKPITPQPGPPYNPIDQASMPRSVFAEFVKAVPNDVIRGIVNDFRSGPAQPSSLAARPNVPVEPAERTNGWGEAAPLSPPPGVALADAMMEQQARIDRVEREVAIAKAKALGEMKD